MDSSAPASSAWPWLRPGAPLTHSHPPTPAIRVAIHPSAQVAARQHARAVLREIATLPPNWDFDGAPAAAPGVIRWTDALLQALPHDRQMPRVTIATDGEVSLFWEGPEHFIDASFSEDGHLAFFARSPAGEGGQDAPWTGQVPEALLVHLPKITPTTAH